MGTEHRGHAATLLGLLLLFASVSTAQAHELSNRREAIVSVDDERVQILLIHEIPAGDEARSLRAMIAWDREGVRGLLGQAVLQQYVLPRALEGLRLVQDTRALPLTVQEISFRDGGGRTAESRGILAAILLEALLHDASPGGDWTRITLSVDAESPVTRAVLQLEGQAWTLVGSDPPPVDDRPIVGPLELDGVGALTMLLRRRRAPP